VTRATSSLAIASDGPPPGGCHLIVHDAQPQIVNETDQGSFRMRKDANAGNRSGSLRIGETIYRL
jgi:hypothetical protein